MTGHGSGATTSERFGPLLQDSWTRSLWAITIVGAALRFWRLGTWSFSGDEGFTIRFSSAGFTWADVRPLAFAFNHYITIPLFGLGEVALRLGPALAGAAAVLVFGWAVSRIYGRQAGVFTALTIALSPMLLVHSQFARYYMQSFLVAGFIPFAVRFWVGGSGARWLWIAVGCAVVGWLLVPSSVFIVPGVLAWLAFNFREVGGVRLIAWARRRLPLLAAGLSLAGVFAVVLVARVLGYESTFGRGEGIAHIALATASGMTLPVAATAVAGLVMLLRDRALPRLDRTMFPLVAAGSALTYVVANRFVYMGAFHAMSVLSVGFVFAGIALARIWGGARDRLVAASAVGIILLTTFPQVMSYYVDGSRLDWRTATERLRDLYRQRPGPVLSNEHEIPLYYAPELNPREIVLNGVVPAWLNDPRRSRPVWLMLAETRKGIYLLSRDPAVAVVLERCLLRDRIIRERYDYYVNAVRIYECPPPAAQSEIAPSILTAASPTP
jgi:hypothetical protein